jgi:hypothetical protein
VPELRSLGDEGCDALWLLLGAPPAGGLREQIGEPVSRSKGPALIANASPMVLPLGFESQAAERYTIGRYSFELTRVFAKPDTVLGFSSRKIDRALCYWACTRMADGPDDGVDANGRWSLSYAEATRSLGSKMTFDRFCSFAELRAILSDLAEKTPNA